MIASIFFTLCPDILAGVAYVCRFPLQQPCQSREGAGDGRVGVGEGISSAPKTSTDQRIAALGCTGGIDILSQNANLRSEELDDGREAGY